MAARAGGDFVAPRRDFRDTTEIRGGAGTVSPIAGHSREAGRTRPGQYQRKANRRTAARDRGPASASVETGEEEMSRWPATKMPPKKPLALPGERLYPKPMRFRFLLSLLLVGAFA